MNQHIARRLLGSLARRLPLGGRVPVITQATGRLPVNGGPVTLVVAVGPGFDQRRPDAATTCRLGMARAFEQLGIPYMFLSTFDLALQLPEIDHPVIWMSGADYGSLDNANLAALRDRMHFVWVNTWFKDSARFCQERDIPDNSWPERTNLKVLSAGPSFVYTISPECSLEYYACWRDCGARLISLPLACDTSVYRPDTPDYPEYAGLIMAFVGGYWRYKARQFDRYLRPYQDQLKIYGYSAWPYAGYGGQLDASREASLYRQARLAPTINEPHVETMGVDLNERVFKVLGSGGMTITDAVAAYRAWFSEEELLVPDSVNQFHEMAREVLVDDDLNWRYRQAGYQAVSHRHTYVQRARCILEQLGIRLPEPHLSDVNATGAPHQLLAFANRACALCFARGERIRALSG